MLTCSQTFTRMRTPMPQLPLSLHGAGATQRCTRTARLPQWVILVGANILNDGNGLKAEHGPSLEKRGS